MPPINATIHFRKFCTDNVIIDQLSAAHSGSRVISTSNGGGGKKTSFTIAYVIMIILAASVMLMSFGYFYYTAENRRRRQLLGGTAPVVHHIESGGGAKTSAAGLTKYDSFSSVKSGNPRSAGVAVKIYNEDPYRHHQHHRSHHHQYHSRSTASGNEQLRRTTSNSENLVPTRPRSVVPRPRTNRTIKETDMNNSASNIYETGKLFPRY